MPEKIKFVDDDPDAVVASMVQTFEALTGRTLQPAQVENLLFKAAGYRIALILTGINETANKCFAVFANGQALEEIGRPQGVTRLPASVASCTIRFTLVAGHGILTIPAGLRVQSTDGQVVFTTIESKTVAADVDTADIKAECTRDGIIGNDYAEGTISVILDPQPYLSAAENLDVTANGGDAETDEQLRQRIYLAPDSFSVAGPTGAYKFFALAAHPNIVDVAVTIGHDLDEGDVDDIDNVIPGQVDIFPLMEDGEDPDSEIIDAINAICNDEKVRPLTDTVVVKAPTRTDYTINVELTLLPDAVQADVEAKVLAALEAYRDARTGKLGIDIIRSQIIGQCRFDGEVYDVNVVAPAADIVLKKNEFGRCTGITVTTTGTHDE